MRQFCYSLILFLFIISLSECSGNKNTGTFLSENLKELNQAISNADEYAKIADFKTDSMRNILNDPQTTDRDKLRQMEQLARFYCPRTADSALYYSTMALNFAKEKNFTDRLYRLQLLRTEALSSCGFFGNAISQYDSLDNSDASPDDKIKYWQTGRRLYSDLCYYIGEGSVFYDKFRELYQNCGDSLIKNLPENNNNRYFLICEQLKAAGKPENARQGLEKIMKENPAGSNIHSMAAFELAQTYENSESDKYAALLAVAALSDVKGAIRDGLALPMLGAWLYREGQLNEAFRYINFALNDAYEGHARMRLVTIADWLPEIDEAYRRDITKQKNHLALYTIILSLLFITLIGVLLYMARQIRKSRITNSALASISKLKDRYIRDFINLCSVYSEKYDSLARTVSRKINSGQTQDLLKIVKYGKASENDNEEFYQTIDNVFLSLYPDFIDKINSLLLPDYQFDNDPSAGLNPELRIYGFVRLGVSESTKIARILNYSINTVYTYRNRMRNRAVNRDSFDADVAAMENE